MCCCRVPLWLKLIPHWWHVYLFFSCLFSWWILRAYSEVNLDSHKVHRYFFTPEILKKERVWNSTLGLGHFQLTRAHIVWSTRSSNAVKLHVCPMRKKFSQFVHISFHPVSAIEGMESALSVCVSASALTDEIFDIQTQNLVEALTLIISRMRYTEPTASQHKEFSTKRRNAPLQSYRRQARKSKVQVIGQRSRLPGWRWFPKFLTG